MAGAAKCRGSVIVQSVSCIGARPNVTGKNVANCTFPNPNTAGNSIVVLGVGNGGSFDPYVSTTDSNSNSYGLNNFQVAGSAEITISSTTAGIAGGSNTVTYTTVSNSYASAFAFEIAGGITFDKTNSVACATCSSINGGNVVPTFASEIMFVMTSEEISSSLTTPSGWTDTGGFTGELSHDDSQDGVTNLSSHTSFQYVTSSATYSDTVGVTISGTPSVMLTVICTWKITPNNSIHRRAQVY
jgi:hypothetical protein